MGRTVVSNIPACACLVWILICFIPGIFAQSPIPIQVESTRERLILLEDKAQATKQDMEDMRTKVDALRMEQVAIKGSVSTIEHMTWGVFFPLCYLMLKDMLPRLLQARRSVDQSPPEE